MTSTGRYRLFLQFQHHGVAPQGAALTLAMQVD